MHIWNSLSCRQRTAPKLRSYCHRLLVCGVALAAVCAFGNTAGADPWVSSTPQASSSGTLTGAVTVTGAPKGFVPPFMGIGACKTGGFATCAHPQVSFASGGTFTLTLPDGTWHVQGFYALAPFGGAFLGLSTTVTIGTGKIVTADLSVPFKKPGAIKGTVSVTHIPSGITVTSKAAVVCPSTAPNPTSGATEITCAETSGPGAYLIATLPPGKWIVYPGYVTKFGLTITRNGTAVTIVSGTVKTVDVTTPYQSPTMGIVSGTATVVSAPAGFTDLTVVLACKGSTFSFSCPSLQEARMGQGSYEFPLTAGTWTLEMLYDPQPYGGVQVGPSRTVTVAAGKVLKQLLTVTYHTPGTAHGVVAVTGVPTKAHILTYTVLACPLGSPYNGDSNNPQCAGEVSGVGSTLGTDLGARLGIAGIQPTEASTTQEMYSIPLPPGKWLLYPGYTTEFGSVVSTADSQVTVRSTIATTRNLATAYRAPTGSSVTGTTTLLDAPAGGSGLFGVEACPSPASTAPGATCQIGTNQIGPNGRYELTVPAGTWWIAELYWFEIPQGGGFSEGEPVAGPSRKIMVKAGTVYSVNLTATYGAG